MKKLTIPILVISGFWAFYEQSKPNPNKVIMVICIAVFMFGLMKLMAKVPSKKEEDHDRFF